MTDDPIMRWIRGEPDPEPPRTRQVPEAPRPQIRDAVDLPAVPMTGPCDCCGLELAEHTELDNEICEALLAATMDAVFFGDS